MRNVTNLSDSASYRTVDEGLRLYMLNTFKYMSFALLITALVAYFIANTTLHRFLNGGLIGLVVTFSPLIYLLFFFNGSKISSISPEKARNSLWVFSMLMGLSLNHIFLLYSGISITRVFFITSSTFAAMSFYGSVTKKDLMGIGSFMIMGLIGILIASLINIFLKSAAVDFAISIIGVIVFTVLVAVDVQKLRNLYYTASNSAIVEKMSVIGALTLYMDFINLFVFLLRFLGERKD
jgi:FtsH-binding integral membrane protein